MHKASQPAKALSQSAFDKDVVQMLVTDMQPLAAVEREGFKKFCTRYLPRYTLPSRRTAGRRLHEMYLMEKEKLVAKLAAVPWMSATADIWSAHKRAYMGVTLHYVESETLKMTSCHLACRRFKGAHTGMAIGEMLYSIFKDFCISAKVQNVVTDNAANFTKAFSLYHTHMNEGYEPTEPDNDNGVDEEDDALGSVDITDLLDDMPLCLESEEAEEIILPPHKRCGNHSLNLVASCDASKAREDKSYQRSYDRAMAKVQALWNSVSRSPKLNDAVDSIIGKTFIQPTCTRWCSEYYAVQRILDIGLDKVVECQTALQLSKMTEADMKFLDSYVSIMKPIADAMKLLEGESDCYLGCVIPTIMGLMKKLQSNSDPAMKPLVNAVIAGLKSRFDSVLTDQEYITAAILHPRFKLAFLPSSDAQLQQRELLIGYVQRVSEEMNKNAQPSASASSQSATDTDPEEENDLYSFMEKTETSGVELSIAKQVQFHCVSPRFHIVHLILII